MHLYDTLKDEAARQCCEQILKMDPAQWDLDSVNRIEIYGTDLATTDLITASTESSIARTKS